jgi:hypothetical protein
MKRSLPSLFLAATTMAMVPPHDRERARAHRHGRRKNTCVWIISPQGKHLGTILTPDRVANIAFGDAESKTLYMAGGRSLWPIRVNIPGIRPVAGAAGS